MKIGLTIGRLLSSRLILILGCQRSGTTLTYMLLSSHPRITGRDESEIGFSLPTWKLLLRVSLRGQYLCCKLPAVTHELKSIVRRFPRAKIVWVMRNPLSVVSSMKSLMLADGQSWLEKWGARELWLLSRLLPEIMAFDLEGMDQISTAAYIWKYKARLMQLYVDSQLKTVPLVYEDLVADPKRELTPVLEDMGLKWDDQIQAHTEVHAGREYAGDTRGDGAIDQGRIDPTLNLDEDEITRVKSIAED